MRLSIWKNKRPKSNQAPRSAKLTGNLYERAYSGDCELCEYDQKKGDTITLMSVLTDKQILIIGNADKKLPGFVEAAKSYGMGVHHLDCKEAVPEKLTELNIHLALLDYAQEKEACRVFFDQLRNIDMPEPIPVFVLAAEESQTIEEVLTMGAADYIMPKEDVESVLHKMKTLFASNDSMFGDSAAIDISPVKADISATGIRVYVIEDDPLLRNLLSIQMDKSSFPYEFNTDGTEAITGMKQFKPQVIILDLMLPGRSGLDLLADIKEESDLSDIPVIVFSNRDGQKDREQASQLGAARFYVKAMTDLSELIETIESLAKS